MLPPFTIQRVNASEGNLRKTKDLEVNVYMGKLCDIDPKFDC